MRHLCITGKDVIGYSESDDRQDQGGAHMTLDQALVAVMMIVVVLSILTNVLYRWYIYRRNGVGMRMLLRNWLGGMSLPRPLALPIQRTSATTAHQPLTYRPLPGADTGRTPPTVSGTRVLVDRDELEWYMRDYARLLRLATQLPPAPAVRGGDTTGMPVLPQHAWLAQVNWEPDVHPHLMVTGPTGSGKTWITLAILQHRPGRFLIVTPKSVRRDPWGGLPVIRLRREDASFALIGEAITAVYTELLRRNAHETAVDDDWLTLVIDEYPLILEEVRGVADTVLRMLRVGRDVRIRLILLSTETSVDALGLRGNGGARNNCLFLTCMPGYRVTLARWEQPPTLLDTTGVPQLASQPLDRQRWWEPPLLELPDRRPGAATPPIPVGGEDNLATHGKPRTDTVPAWLTPEAIRALYTAFGSQNKVAALLVGDKQSRNAAIKRALHEDEVQA